MRPAASIAALNFKASRRLSLSSSGSIGTPSSVCIAFQQWNSKMSPRPAKWESAGRGHSGG